MLPKPEYDNFYKFIVSAGVLMVAIAFALPWFALQLSEPVNAESRSSGAESELDPRRRAIGDFALTLWPWASGVLGLGGIVATAYGLSRWKEGQAILDDLRVQERDLVKKQVEAMSPSEIAAEATAEAELEEVPENVSPLEEPSRPLERSEKEATRSRILSVETRVLTLVQSGFKWTHVARPHMRLGPMSVDLLLEAKDRALKDILVEVKYLRGGLHIATYILDVSLAVETYPALTGRPADALLILVIAQPGRDQDYKRREADIDRRVREAQTVIESPVKTMTLREADLPNLDAADLMVGLPPNLGGERET